MSLPGFPVAVEGETIPSVVARHLQRTAGPRSRALSFLGLRHAAASAVVPPQLAALAEAMPEGHPWFDNPSGIVAHHTLVPLYVHFASPRRADSVLTAIQTNSTANPAASLGLTIAASRNLSSGYKFCPECVAHDVSTRGRGFSVAYREHQPPFVRACALHLRPLLFGCGVCQANRKALGMWQMAGRCDCKSPQHEPAHTVRDDPVYEASVSWLAKQVRSILSKDRPACEESMGVRLRAALDQSGFKGRTGLDSDAVESALTSRFGLAFLQSVDAPGTTRSAAGSRWPSRLLGSTTMNGERTPNVLLSLLLTGLVADNIDGLWTAMPDQSVQPSLPVPSGYSTPRELGREMLSKEAIESALQASKGKIAAAALSLQVSPSNLAVDMQRQGIRLRLPAVTAKRLGPDLIAAVKQALQAGTAKAEIQRSLGISEWSLQLIELDAPKLREVHRKATIEMQRSAHRRAVLQHLHLHPSARRTDIATDCAAAFDWLRRFDSAWLERSLPRPRRAKNNGRGPRKDWTQIDRACAATIRATAREELEQQSRPTRLTPTRLLRAAGVLNKEASLVPLAVHEAKACSESEDAFLRRKIKWALVEYSNQHVPVSINKLRRVAGLPPRRLIRYGEYIVEIACALSLTIDARCALSPLRK